MVDKLKTIWLDGRFLDWDDARVHVLTHSLHYGMGAFEGIRAYKRAGGETTIFRLREHIARLFDSCRLVMMKPTVTAEAVERACVDIVQKNGMEDAYLRPLAWVGEGSMGVFAPDNPVHVGVMAWRWGAYLGTEGLEQGIRTKISSWARHHVAVSMPKGKIVGQYTNSMLAKRDAKMTGFDEAILLDTSGYVTEGSGENLFIVKDGVLRTPPLSASILAGITRDTVLNLAHQEGIPVSEEMIGRDQLYLADEAFFTGTAAEVTPIREVDLRTIGSGTRGPITTRLQTRYFDIVRGSDNGFPEWLTRVSPT